MRIYPEFSREIFHCDNKVGLKKKMHSQQLFVQSSKGFTWKVTSSPMVLLDLHHHLKACHTLPLSRASYSSLLTRRQSAVTSRRHSPAMPVQSSPSACRLLATASPRVPTRAPAEFREVLVNDHMVLNVIVTPCNARQAIYAIRLAELGDGSEKIILFSLFCGWRQNITSKLYSWLFRIGSIVKER